VDDWFWDEDDGMNEGVFGDDERILLWISDSDFLVFLWGGGRGNSNGGIPNISLCDLVNIQDEGKLEETLAWDNLDSSWDREIPCNLWIKDRISGVSTEEGWFDFLGETLVDCKAFLCFYRRRLIWFPWRNTSVL